MVETCNPVILKGAFGSRKAEFRHFRGKTLPKTISTLSYTGFFGLAGHGRGGGDGIHHTFITLLLFDGFELNLVQ